MTLVVNVLLVLAASALCLFLVGFFNMRTDYGMELDAYVNADMAVALFRWFVVVLLSACVALVARATPAPALVFAGIASAFFARLDLIRFPGMPIGVYHLEHTALAAALFALSSLSALLVWRLRAAM